MIGHTPVAAGHKVLDCGCGYGRPGTRLAERTGCSVVGITISDVQAHEANRYAGERGLAERVLFQRMDAMAMDFADQSFDSAWAFECLFHMPDRAQVLRELGRVLKPGGRLLLTDSCESQEFSPLESRMVREGFHVNSFITPEQYGELLNSVGFDVITLEDITHHTKQTVARVMAATEAKAEQLRGVYGDAFLSQMLQSGPYLDLILREKMRYFMIVAQRR